MTTPEARTGQELYARARKLIPGGTQLLSKRPEMFLPDHWPAYYSRARGAETWDLDGRRYLDFTHFGVGTCVLGFADPDVERAVVDAVQAGSMSTLNCPEEVELAELLLDLHPWAEAARFARGGGEAMAMAARICRAATGRDRIAFCGYHGWHDWYLAANLGMGDVLEGHLLRGLEPAGVPRGLAGTMLPFRYNKIEELEQIVMDHGRDLAAVVMEPVRESLPEPGFLEKVRGLAASVEAVLVFDEITSGWRMNTGGIHLLHHVDPDLSVFSKALGNGYPMAALIGRRDVMEASQASFISSTYWTERIGPVAALATVRKHAELDVGGHLVAVGERVQEGWRHAAAASGLQVHVCGIPPLSHLSFSHENSDALATLFAQEMLDRGYLASSSFYPSYAHKSKEVETYLQSISEVFSSLAEAVERNEVEAQLRGPVKHSGFERLT
jgi:glutamate-1-semialdehyde aminotransferase